MTAVLPDIRLNCQLATLRFHLLWDCLHLIWLSITSHQRPTYPPVCNTILSQRWCIDETYYLCWGLRAEASKNKTGILILKKHTWNCAVCLAHSGRHCYYSSSVCTKLGISVSLTSGADLVIVSLPAVDIASSAFTGGKLLFQLFSHCVQKSENNSRKLLHINFNVLTLQHYFVSMPYIILKAQHANCAKHFSSYFLFQLLFQLDVWAFVININITTFLLSILYLIFAHFLQHHWQHSNLCQHFILVVFRLRCVR